MWEFQWRHFWTATLFGNRSGSQCSWHQYCETRAEKSFCNREQTGIQNICICWHHNWQAASPRLSDTIILPVSMFQGHIVHNSVKQTMQKCRAGQHLASNKGNSGGSFWHCFMISSLDLFVLLNLYASRVDFGPHAYARPGCSFSQLKEPRC